MNKSFLGILLTSLWIVLITIIIIIQWEEAISLELNEWGDFLAGNVSGLALLWLILGYFQQSEELKQNTKVLHDQKEELSRQIEEQNRIAISISYQELTSIFNNFIMNIASNSELCKIYETGRNSPDYLSASELSRFYLLCSQFFSFHENLLILNTLKVLPGNLYDGWFIDLKKNMNQPGFLKYWSLEGDEYTKSFQDKINEIINLKN